MLARRKAAETLLPRLARGMSENADEEAWSKLAKQGVPVNPCRSPHHPAAGLGLSEEGPEVSVQEAYDPESSDFVCGPKAEGGVGLKSYRMRAGGLRARLAFTERFESTPGIVSPGMIASCMEAHGNWTAGIAVLDRQKLPKPPLLLAKSFSIDLAERASPDEVFTLTSRVLNVDESFFHMSVRVEVSMAHPAESQPRAVSTADYERIGAIRSL